MKKCLANRLRAKPIIVNNDSVIALASGWLSTIRFIVGLREKDTPPFEIGDVLYVKEKWNEWKAGDYFYLADATLKGTDFLMDGENMMRFNRSSTMPVEAARYFLVVQEVTKRKLQDITNEEIEQELVGYKEINEVIKGSIDTKEVFATRWNKHYDVKKGFPSWSSNPDVWVVTFKTFHASELESKEE